ncbi:hypothetical protein GUJ93_ZPchr0009g289 [Zizania palustris]|uniref:CP12 domain-containing protein n=1 Tax=Zizania palustris TaxID=103762 RepID=A0A8J5UXX3_ZIZPA|nr:hypothetical protein GUJ93_ZPchr0009g289 [Zizania palustris]
MLHFSGTSSLAPKCVRFRLPRLASSSVSCWRAANMATACDDELARTPLLLDLHLSLHRPPCRSSVCHFAKASCHSSACRVRGGQSRAWWPRRSCASTPPELAQKVSESIKQTDETCVGDLVGGECAAAWDEVEELSAAANHACDRKKDNDPFEGYCKDNLETDECRTYEYRYGRTCCLVIPLLSFAAI